MCVLKSGLGLMGGEAQPAAEAVNVSAEPVLQPQKQLHSPPLLILERALSLGFCLPSKYSVNF